MEHTEQRDSTRDSDNNSQTDDIESDLDAEPWNKEAKEQNKKDFQPEIQTEVWKDEEEFHLYRFENIQSDPWRPAEHENKIFPYISGCACFLNVLIGKSYNLS